MAGWLEREPTLLDMNNALYEVGTRMRAKLDDGFDLEGSTFTYELEHKLNPAPIRRVLIDRLHHAGVEVEIDIYPVPTQNRWDIMVVCIGTMAPAPEMAIR